MCKNVCFMKNETEYTYVKGDRTHKDEQLLKISAWYLKNDNLHSVSFRCIRVTAYYRIIQMDV